VSPTYSVAARAAREYARLSPEERKQFNTARRNFVIALRVGPASIPLGLRVKRVPGYDGVWEMSWAPDGRATFEYGPEQIPGRPHVRWRRIGNHSIFADP
jgi:hypothetical protein